jgi:hypothetical protein
MTEKFAVNLFVGDNTNKGKEMLPSSARHGTLSFRPEREISWVGVF